eukprot:3720563-Pyramimonas_sp.AAC.1
MANPQPCKPGCGAGGPNISSRNLKGVWMLRAIGWGGGDVNRSGDIAHTVRRNSRRRKSFVREL